MPMGTAGLEPVAEVALGGPTPIHPQDRHLPSRPSLGTPGPGSQGAVAGMRLMTSPSTPRACPEAGTLSSRSLGRSPSPPGTLPQPLPP